MYYTTISTLPPSSFRRRVGVKPATFLTMVKELKKHASNSKNRTGKRNKKNAGRKPSLSIEDQLLLTLMYWREYRTQFHIATDYGISESQVCRIIQRTENVLSKSKKFELPQRKKPAGSKLSYEFVLIDATETPIERPKKNSKNIIPVKRNAIH